MYSKDIRDCVLHKRHNLKESTIAKDLNLSKSTVQYIVCPKKKTGKRVGRKSKISEKSRRYLVRSIKKSLTCNEKVTANKLINTMGLSVHIRTMHRMLHKISCSWKPFKKEIELSSVHKRVRICTELLKKQINFEKNRIYR